MDKLGKHVEKQCKKPPRTYRKLIPDEAIDSCETSYEAADGSKKKAAMDNFDDTGVMALICCHDIPLFFANIDSPGEQQKYALALIRRQLHGYGIPTWVMGMGTMWVWWVSHGYLKSAKSLYGGYSWVS